MNKKNLICFGQCVAAGIVGAFITHILIQYFGGYIEACKAKEPNTLCTREWVSALSGWIAAGGALIAAWLTINKLRQQIAEQKKQTDFLVGDAMPTLDCLQDINDPQQIVIRIVNWNRRTVLIHGIGFDNMDTTNLTTAIMEIKQNDVIIREPIRQPIINGWEDRNKAPNNLKIKIAAERNGTILDEFPSDLQIRVMVRLIGQSHDITILLCNLNPHA